MTWQPRRLRLENLESRRLLAAVQIPDDLAGQAGAEVAAPVMIDTAAGIRGAEIRLKYDPSLLTLSPEDITAGSSWADAEDAELVANVDQTTGTVTIFVFASEQLGAGSGSLVILTFGVRQDAAVGEEAILDLVTVRLNEGQIPVNPAPIAGPDPTDGQITIEGEPGVSDRISGFVYADTNNDNLPGSLEGIPGVEITLVNTRTDQQFKTVTDASGAFEFTQLPAGRYQLIQTQPLAYINGGPNEFTVDLAAGGNLENQNFRELGLRAPFVYNRLLTTTALPVGSANWIEVLEQINLDAANSPDAAGGDAAGNGQEAAANAAFQSNALAALTPSRRTAASSSDSPPVAAAATASAPLATSAAPAVQLEGASRRRATASAAPQPATTPTAAPPPTSSHSPTRWGGAQHVDRALAGTRLW